MKILVCQYVDMVCPFCGRIKTSVRNTRPTSRRGSMWRRRQCESCGRLFTTREFVELGFLEVLKRSGKREPYSRAKLLRSLILATDHLSDPEPAFAISETIEASLLSNLDQYNQLSSNTIAKETLTVLKRFDTRAYVKYLSYQTETLDAHDLRRRLVGQ